MPCGTAAFRSAALVLLLLGHGALARAELTIAAASDLQVVLPQIADRFTKATGQTLRIAYGSSGNFVSQIQNSAPFDLFLSADTEYVQRLVSSGHAVGATATEYATGRLALWARTDRHLDVSRGLALLADPSVRTIAIGNPEHAPYGRAAMAALQQSGSYEQAKRRLVLGENIAQAAQFVESGSADAGLIALSLALSPALRAAGVFWEVPQTLYPPIRQEGVVLTRSTQRGAAEQFLAFLTRPDIARLLQASGLGAAR
jgi:molybdate transport system substrate-binding protein